MPSDSSRAVDVILLWPLVGAAVLGLASVLVARSVSGRAVRSPVAAGAGVAVLAAVGLWAWLVSDATVSGDGSSHLDHMSGVGVPLAVATLAVAIAAAALRRHSSRTYAVAAVAVAALACVAQTYGFLGYATPG